MRTIDIPKGQSTHAMLNYYHWASKVILHLLLLHDCQPLEKMLAFQLFNCPVWYFQHELFQARWRRDTPPYLRGSWPHRLHGGPVRPCCGVPLVQRLVALHWTANQHPRSVLTLWINPLCSADMPSSSWGTTKPEDRALRVSIHYSLIEGGRITEGDNCNFIEKSHYGGLSPRTSVGFP